MTSRLVSVPLKFRTVELTVIGHYFPPEPPEIPDGDFIIHQVFAGGVDIYPMIESAADDDEIIDKVITIIEEAM